MDGRDERGHTALMSAAGAPNPSTFELLLQRGASIHNRTRIGGTVLMHAVQGGSLRVLRALLAAPGCDKVPIDAKDKGQGHSALMIAAMLGYTAIVELLLDAGASVQPEGQHWRIGDAYRNHNGRRPSRNRRETRVTWRGCHSNRQRKVPR